MKKIYLSILLVCAALTSCDMDLSQKGALDDQSGLQKLDDFYRYRNGFYNILKAENAGAYHAYPDIQMDQFFGIISNGNREGNLSNATFTSSESEFESYWAAAYSNIADVNFVIPKLEAKIADETVEEDDLIQLKRYLGEAYFTRAFQYWMLVDKFCENYSSVGGSTAAKGVPIVTEYNPGGDTSLYPGRSTQDETYELINSDLDKAYAALVEFEASTASDAQTNVAPMAEYLSSWAVVAMQARVALLKGDYETAYNKASQVIESGVYKLATISELEDLYKNDESNEIIFRPYCSTTELPSSTGTYYIGTDEQSADYIPTIETLSLLSDDDARFEQFFDAWYLDVEGTYYGVYVFSKFNGNADLQVSTITPNYMHYPKPFRLSEMYLIAAEAGASVNVSGGSAYLNTFMATRHSSYVSASYNASTLLQTAKDERTIEFIGEGMRMSDLRRWKQGFTRSTDYSVVNSSVNSIAVTAGNLTYENDDYRFVWPIPSAEIESNPQLVGQQNPGY